MGIRGTPFRHRVFPLAQPPMAQCDVQWLVVWSLELHIDKVLLRDLGPSERAEIR